MTTTSTPCNAAVWFEIPARDLDRQQAFYEALLGRPMRREAMGPSQGAVFAYDASAQGGSGGALMSGPTAPTHAAGGTLVYLDASPSLDAALARAAANGAQVTLPRQALPGDLGVIAHIIDPEGNRVGLHASA